MDIDWEAWKYLLGEWESEPTNEPNQSAGRFSFRFDLGENILIRENRSILPANEASEEYMHADLMIVYSEAAGAKQAIYFDNEQHVIHYKVSVSADQKTINLESEASASTPQFRFTYHKIDENTLEARFEIAPPGNQDQFLIYREGKARKTGTA
jgi:hypothetical protein